MHDLPDEVRADVRGLRVDAAADAAEQRDRRAAEAVRRHALHQDLDRLEARARGVGARRARREAGEVPLQAEHVEQDVQHHERERAQREACCLQ